MVLSNKEDAGVLERAEKLNVPSKTFTKAQFTEGESSKNGSKKPKST